MYKEQSVAVVVTAYNEEGFVGNVIDEIPTFVDRVYAIDDCSTDNTWVEINSRTEDHYEHDTEVESIKVDGGESSPVIIPIRHNQNRGVGGSIKTGYKTALRDKMDITAVINGDGQMDPSILDQIIDPIASDTADYVKGNRLYIDGQSEEMPTWRLSGNALLTFFTKIASGYWKMNDAQNGYTAISLKALQHIDIDSLYDRYGFLNDLLVHLNLHNFRIADVEMSAIYGEEESGIRYTTFVPRLSYLLLWSFLWRLKNKYLIHDFHPLVLMYGLGTIGLLGSVAATAWSLLVPEFTGFSVLLCGLLFLLSSSIVVLAMILDMECNKHIEKHVRQ